MTDKAHNRKSSSELSLQSHASPVSSLSVQYQCRHTLIIGGKEWGARRGTLRREYKHLQKALAGATRTVGKDVR